MKVTYNWLKDFVDIKIAPGELAEKLTMAGIEVGAIEEKSGDFIFEIEITSNRPDWLSVAGIAREVAAITNSKFKAPQLNAKLSKAKAGSAALNIDIRDKKDCPFYAATLIQGTRVGASPGWLKQRLELIGCRSVNNVVDITNYILFTWGEPLHAFDSDKLALPKIIVRRALPGEKVVAIDGSEKTLDADIPVIADAARAQAIAGIMGLKDSEVSFSTRNVLLESAVFNPVLIRRARQKLGMQSESSYRFERGIDISTVLLARTHAVNLIQELCSGQHLITDYKGELPKKQSVIILDPLSVKRILGIQIKGSRMKSILGHLGFTVRPAPKGVFKVCPPHFRQDVEKEVDLIEELARIYGYDQVPVTYPKVSPQLNIMNAKDRVALVKNLLVGLGSQEVITYSMIDRAWIRGFVSENELPVEILNPLSKEQEILRPTLIPSLLKCVNLNLNQGQDYVNIFEIAKKFSRKEKEPPQEELVLGIVCSGTKSSLLSSGRVRHDTGILDLKGMVQTIFSRLGVKEWFFKAESGKIAVYVSGEKIGSIWAISRLLLDKFEIKNNSVAAAQVLLEPLLKQCCLKKTFQNLPAYPGIQRDISLVIKEKVEAEEILVSIKENGATFLKDAVVSDFYKGKQIPPGFKGLTISCLYRSDMRTLTEAEVEPVHARIMQNLAEKFSAQFR